MKPALRRRYVWVLLLLAAVAAGYGVHRAMRPAWEDTEAWKKYERIRFDMQADNVRALFGRRWDHWDRERGWDVEWAVGDDQVGVWFVPKAPRYRISVGQKWAVIHGRVYLDPPDGPPCWLRERPWLDRLRDRLGL